ncbi:MAG: hypothetical protein ACOCYC_00470 [bacterium]
MVIDPDSVRAIQRYRRAMPPRLTEPSASTEMEETNETSIEEGSRGIYVAVGRRRRNRRRGNHYLPQHKGERIDYYA